MRFRQTSQKARLHMELAPSRDSSYLPYNALTNRSTAARACALLAALILSCFLLTSASAQTTNPVDRKVENPITDTPYVNPLQQDQPVRPATSKLPPIQAGDSLTVDCHTQTSTGPKNALITTCEGNVDARIGSYRLQADKVTVYDATNLMVADGNVVFDQGDQQRITGSHAEWNYRTKTGFFVNSTGYTNQTNDGTRMYFIADRVERVSLNVIVLTNVEITACDEEKPKWSFHAKKVRIKTNDRARMTNPTFRIKGVPVIYMPYASMSLKRVDRASGFLTPTFSGSGAKGFRISDAYYLTLGRSADFTLRGDLFSQRGIGVGGDFRARPNSRSCFNMGFYAVKDRILGPKKDAQHPDQGGSSFYIDAVHYFPNGFLAAADVNITSSLAFRQIFSDSIQQAISPEERSQVFINKNYHAYSFNFIATTQVISIPTERIRTRQMPGISFDKRPGLVSWLKGKLPLYFSFQSSVAGMSRKETVEDQAALLANGIKNPVITPTIVQRLDFRPEVTLPLNLDGWNFTATAAARGTFYS